MSAHHVGPRDGWPRDGRQKEAERTGAAWGAMLGGGEWVLVGDEDAKGVNWLDPSTGYPPQGGLATDKGVWYVATLDEIRLVCCV